MDPQEILSLAVVAAAALLLGRAYFRRRKNKGRAACGGSCGTCASGAEKPGTP
jgi:hypothetical protein